MDKKQILGFILIGLVITAGMVYNSINTRPIPKKSDSTATQQAEQATPNTSASNPVATATSQSPAVAQESLYGKIFDASLKGVEEIFIVENDLLEAKISSKGGVLKEWRLKNFKNWNQDTVQLIPYDSHGEFGVFFTTDAAKRVDTRDLYFTLGSSKQPQNGRFIISNGDSLVVTARLTLENGAAIAKSYTFYSDKYSITAGVKLSNMESVIATANRKYEVGWADGLRYQERNSVDESNAAKAVIAMNGSNEELDAKENNVSVKTSGSGAIDFTAIKTKYFIAAMIPLHVNNEAQADLEGFKSEFPGGGAVESYSMKYRLSYKSGGQEEKFTLYLGPISYDILKGYGLESTVELGFKWLVRPIGEWIMLPIFKGIHSFIPNYGLAIIIFSILMKLALYPFSISQIKSSAKMQLLQPEMTRIREKYKDDQQSQQQEQMRLYSEYGINPAGGCLPLLLQMPVLYALWAVLNSAIDLRQAHFFGWITDLSIPDVLVTLPMKVPLFGVDKLSGLALLMGVTMFIQQKISITDPRQKGMIYIMPIMFTLMFSNFPGGLNLYYFMFNVLGILQQLWLTKFSKNKLTLADLKKSPKKEGWIAKKMREAQEIASSQGRTLPGQGNQKQIGQKKKK